LKYEYKASITFSVVRSVKSCPTEGRTKTLGVFEKRVLRRLPEHMGGESNRKLETAKSTRKENGWETEETLERAAVTLETERAKRPNP
jgi:hypothetical protein